MAGGSNRGTAVTQGVCLKITIGAAAGLCDDALTQLLHWAGEYAVATHHSAENLVNDE